MQEAEDELPDTCDAHDEATTSLCVSAQPMNGKEAPRMTIATETRASALEAFINASERDQTGHEKMRWAVSP